MTAPRRPSDVDARATLATMVEAHDEHTGALVWHRVGLGDPLGDGQVTEHALAALAYKHEIASRVLAHRWLTAGEALAVGASLLDVATACGLTPVEVATGIRSWADGQEHLHGECGLGLSPAEADEVRALVADPADEGGEDQ